MCILSFMSVLPGCYANSEGRKSGNPTAENYFKINLNFWSLMSSDRGSYEIFDAVNLSSYIVFS